MKKTIQLLCAVFTAAIYSTANAACPTEPGCNTNWLNVPGDFANPVNNFTMFLLGGWFNIEMPNGSGGWIGVSGSYNGGSTSLNTTGNQINFTATQFDHSGPGQGTSTLNASLDHVVLGSGFFFDNLATIYADGLASGTLVDNTDSTRGHWTLNTHLYADWNGITGMDLGIMPLSTNASYTYTNTVEVCYIDDGCYQVQRPNTVMAGSAMDYHSGLAFMAGQGILQSGPFNGLRVTLGLEGQDPLATPATVPVPTAAWLLTSGLIGLAGFARKRKTA